jgi:hypothetical protein
MTRHCPRAPKHVVSFGKVCKGLLHLQKERSRLVDQRKWLEETRLRVGLVSNSGFLNGDVGITGLVIPIFSKQIMVSLSCLPSALLSSSIVPPRYILCVLHFLVDIMYV